VVPKDIWGFYIHKAGTTPADIARSVASGGLNLLPDSRRGNILKQIDPFHILETWDLFQTHLNIILQSTPKFFTVSKRKLLSWLVLRYSGNVKSCIVILWVVMRCSLVEGRYSSVGIATGYGLDGPGIETRWGRDFPHLSRPALGPAQTSVRCVPGHYRG
jgi:hypothetical protein